MCVEQLEPLLGNRREICINRSEFVRSTTDKGDGVFIVVTMVVDKPARVLKLRH